MPSDSAKLGKVYLVGAGPGDPGLITLRGIEVLARADVVLYDYLVNPQILQHARPDCERICLGQHGQTRIWPQEEVNAAMVRFARQGRVVVRLKGGDPIIFGRYAEETDALAAHAVPLEVVPGITAALAAGSYAGVPITHRDFASAAALITGQERAGKQDSALDYQALAHFPGTLVIYMGVTTAPLWSAALLEAGKSPDTPVAIVRHCSLPNQQTILCTLETVCDHLAIASSGPIPSSKLRPPVVFVVGEVARLAGSGSWFERRPLFGKRILVTRPHEQADVLRDALAELGAEVLVQPAITISAPADWQPVDQALERLRDYHWLVFSSANGVSGLLERLLATGRDMRCLGGLQIAAIGSATAGALTRYGLRSDLVPSEFRAEALADALQPHAPGRRFLLARASRGRDLLAQRLQQAGGTVDQVVVYQSTDVQEADPEIRQQLSQGKIHWITVTSSAIARSLGAMFESHVGRARLASISPVTTAALKELDLDVSAEATSYTMAGVAQAIVEWEEAARKSIM